MLFDGGNFTDNPTDAGEVRTRTLLEQMDSLGYRAIAVGERDLGLGFDEFQRRVKGIRVPFLATNIVQQGTKNPVLPPYVIVNAKARDGKPLRIGVLSVVRYNPVWLKAGPNGTNLAIASPAEMLQKYLAEVRSKSDVVILMGAMAKDDLRQVVRQSPGIDLVYGSYGGIFTAIEEPEGNVPVYYAGNQGKRISETRITLGEKRGIESVVTYMHVLNAAYPEDKSMSELVATVNGKLGIVAPDAAKRVVASPQKAPSTVAH